MERGVRKLTAFVLGQGNECGSKMGFPGSLCLVPFVVFGLMGAMVASMCLKVGKSGG